jgi:CRP-like cAMP-binding protein
MRLRSISHARSEKWPNIVDGREPYMRAQQPTMAQNHLLAAFPPQAVAELHEMQEPTPRGRVLFEPGEEAGHAFFPHEGTVISLVRVSADGGEVEVGVVGGEGFTEVHTLLASSSYRTRGVVQAEGSVSRVPLAALRDLLGSDQAVRTFLLSYVSFHIEQVAQNALCNGVHAIEQRLAKWLLIMRDRAGKDTLHLTHEFLAQMLGIRRSGVTVALGILGDHALIEHARNRIVLLDPAAIEERACDCYSEMASVLASFFAKLPPPRKPRRRN